jgi:hypothetical protein
MLWELYSGVIDWHGGGEQRRSTTTERWIGLFDLEHVPEGGVIWGEEGHLRQHFAGQPL